MIDRAFCERRAKIELRTFLDGLDRRPRKRARNGHAGEEGFALERRAFAERLFDPATRKSLAARIEKHQPTAEALNPIPPLPAVVAIADDGLAANRLAAEMALRGASVLVLGSVAKIAAHIESARSRGYLTPLEAAQARSRVAAVDSVEGFRDAGLVFASDAEHVPSLAGVVRSRAVIAVGRSATRNTAFSRRVVGVEFDEARVKLLPTVSTDGDVTAALAAWLKPLGYGATVRKEQPANPICYPAQASRAA